MHSGHMKYKNTSFTQCFIDIVTIVFRDAKKTAGYDHLVKQWSSNEVMLLKICASLLFSSGTNHPILTVLNKKKSSIYSKQVIV